MGIVIKQSIKGSFYAYLGIILGFFTSALLMPKILSEEQVGLLRLLTSITILLAQVANFGFSAAAVKYFPQFRNENKQHNGYLFWASFISVIGLTITITLFILYQKTILDFLNVAASPLLEQYLIWVIPITIFSVIFSVFDNYARFLYNSSTGIFLKEFIQRVFLLIAILLFYFELVTFKGYFTLYAIALSIPALLIVFYIWKKDLLFLKPIKGFWNKKLLKGFASLSILTFLSGFTSQVVNYIDQIQVTSLISLSANGIYSTMMFFGTVIYTPTFQINRIGSTIVAESWQQNDLKAIANVYEKSCLTLLIIGSFLFICIVTNLHNVFEILPNYETGKWVMIWIGIGKLFDMATGLNGTILQTSKYYYFDTIFMIFLIIGTWLMNKWLIPIYGITGSAIATASIILIFNLFRTAFVWLKFGFYPFSIKNLYVLFIALFVFALISLLPPIKGVFGWPNYLFDTPIRISIITFIFIGIIYKTKLSNDINETIEKGIKTFFKLKI